MFRPTIEQRAVIDACIAGADVVLEAGAGTGKSATLRVAAEALNRSRGLYLAYNRATAEAARRTFPAHVKCLTAHALAYRAVGYKYADRLSARRMPSWAVARELGIGGPLPLGKDLLLTPAHQARIVHAMVERFCRSSDESLSALHVPSVHGLGASEHAELTWHMMPLAQRMWSDIRSPGGRLRFDHDHYLKLWQLSRPVIAADYLMFDEAQDADPVTAAIVQAQALQKIAAGDSCQAIYEWRGAVDALSSWPCDARLYLTQSFRFGPGIADEANKWLTTLRAPYRLTGVADRSAVGPVADPQVIVCRTNAEAFAQAYAALEHGRKVALTGSSARALKGLAQAALDLRSAGRTGHPELAAFRSWDQVREYSHTGTAGADLAAGVRLIDSRGAAMILGVIDSLTREDAAEVISCTVHAAKGREWDRVRIGNDFPRPGTGKAIPPGEAMLAYVAVTRAQSALDHEGLAWVDHHEVPAPRKEAINMDTQQDNPLAETEGPRPYAGGRAQAESGSRIIATDYAAWTAVAGTLSGSNATMVQLGQQWRNVVQHGLDDAGLAAGRYRLLAHAAETVAALPEVDERPASVLSRLAGHARLHAVRLRATAEQQFAKSRKAGPYNSRGHAESGS
jgi:hypothetical protein